MPTDYSGIIDNIQNNLPVELEILDSTNASPIVMQTLLNHNLQTGDWVLVRNHATNTNANGYWKVVVVDDNTVQLVGSNGNGIGAGTGTLLGLNLGRYQIPSGADLRNAASVNVGFETLGDRTSFLWYLLGWARNVFAGGVETFLTGATATFQSAANLVGQAGANLTWSGVATFSDRIFLTGRKALRRARVTLSDADHTVDVTQGDVFVLPGTPGAPRTITLDSSLSVFPAVGETLTFLWRSTSIGPSVVAYTFKTSGGTTIATFKAAGLVTTNHSMSATFQAEASGVWRLADNSGTLSDGTNDYGVIPGAGA